jgi:hypothetical protein
VVCRQPSGSSFQDDGDNHPQSNSIDAPRHPFFIGDVSSSTYPVCLVLLIQDQHIPHLPHGGEENGQPEPIPGVGATPGDGVGKDPVPELAVGLSVIT